MFDPYQTWLAIPLNERPPTYYQLLGIAALETDRRLIQEAAICRMSQIRIYQTGPYERECVRLLNEIAQAETTLLDPARRQAYDAQLERGATNRRKGPCRAVSRQELAIPYPALAKRLAAPPTPGVAGASPFEQLFEPGPIIECRASSRFRLEEKDNHRYRGRKSRHVTPDPLVVVYLGFLILAGVLGFWFAG